MPKIKYVDVKLRPGSLKLVDKANEIIREYTAQGFTLTLRQLYYQFVSRDLIENTVKSYKRLGSIINDARLAGLLDWSAIEDRTREVVSVSHWSNPGDIVSAAAQSFRIDKWQGQEWRPEVWIEKEALAGVVEGVCRELDISFLSCRGYTSQSEMWSSAMRFVGQRKRGQKTLVLHFGDHDPSGLDMTRDIEDRMAMFGAEVKLKRIALNMDQVERYNPPPNPAKVTDARFAGYQAQYGDESWELDALEPRVLVDLVRAEVEAVRSSELWDERVNEEQAGRESLIAAASRWDDVVEFLEG